MQADRIPGTHMLQHVQVVAAVAEIVFAVDFQPAGPWMRLEEFPVMARAQADADAAHCGVTFGSAGQAHAGITSARAIRDARADEAGSRGLFLERQFAAELVAGALGHVIQFSRGLSGPSLPAPEM